MKNERLLVLLAILGLIVIVAAGVGYAYTAITVSENNSVEVEYLTVKPSDGSDPVYSSSFTNGVAFDTVTGLTDKGESADPRYVQEITYTLADGTFETIGGHEYSKMGDIYIDIDESKSDRNYGLSVMVIDGEGLNTTDFSYYALFKVGSADGFADAKTIAEAQAGVLVQFTDVSGDMVASTSTITNDSENTHTVVYISIYVGMNGGDSITRPLTPLVSTKVLDEVEFVFKATTV